MSSRITRTTLDIDDPILKKLEAIQARDGRSSGRLVSDPLARRSRARSRRRRPGASPGPRAPVRGNTVPDAHLAAILRQNGVTRLYTTDRDFRRFVFLRVIDPIG